MDGSQAVQEHTGALKAPPRRVLVQVLHDGPETASVQSERMTFHAARLAGIFGDRLLLDVSGLGEHMFQREDGRWSSGGSVLLNASLLDFHIVEDIIGRGDSDALEWVPGTQPADVMPMPMSAKVIMRGPPVFAGNIGRIR